MRVALQQSGSHSGQSIAEYAMIGSLIGFVCIIALFVLEINVQSLFGASNRGMVASASTPQFQPLGPSPAGSLSSGPPSVSPLPVTPSASSLPLGAPSPVSFGNIPATQLCFSGNGCYFVPDISGNPVDSSGSQGNQLAQYSANVLSQIAAQINADPNADPTLQNQITQLANQGHGLGNTMSQLSAAGPTMNINNVNNVSGLTVSQYQTSVGGFQNTLSMMNTYIAAHPGIINGGVAGLINLEAGQISSFANAYLVSTGSTYAPMLVGLQSSSSSQIVHQDSNTICNSGGSGCVQPVAAGGG